MTAWLDTRGIDHDTVTLPAAAARARLAELPDTDGPTRDEYADLARIPVTPGEDEAWREHAELGRWHDDGGALPPGVTRADFLDGIPAERDGEDEAF